MRGRQQQPEASSPSFSTKLLLKNQLLLIILLF